MSVFNMFIHLAQRRTRMLLPCPKRDSTSEIIGYPLMCLTGSNNIPMPAASPDSFRVNGVRLCRSEPGLFTEVSGVMS